MPGKSVNDEGKSAELDCLLLQHPASLGPAYLGIGQIYCMFSDQLLTKLFLCLCINVIPLMRGSADPGELYPDSDPDPTFEKKTGSESDIRANNLIGIRPSKQNTGFGKQPNFNPIKFTFYFLLST